MNQSVGDVIMKMMPKEPNNVLLYSLEGGLNETAETLVFCHLTLTAREAVRMPDLSPTNASLRSLPHRAIQFLLRTNIARDLQTLSAYGAFGSPILPLAAWFELYVEALICCVSVLTLHTDSTSAKHQIEPIPPRLA